MMPSGDLKAPQNLEAESAVLGGILDDHAALDVVLGILEPGDFYRESHRKIFRAMIDLHEQRKPVDLIMLNDALAAADNLEAVGGAAYIAGLHDSTPTAANIRYHAALVKRCADLRRQIEVFREALERAGNGLEDPAELAGVVASKLLSFRSAQSCGFISIQDIIVRGLKRIEAANENKSPLRGIPTGITSFEKQCGALRPGNLLVIGGRTSTGKTSLALGIARSAAASGFTSAFVSAESPLPEIAVRLLSQASGIENTKLSHGLLRDADFSRVMDSAARLADLPLFFLGGCQRWEIIKSFARGLKSRHSGLSLICLDYAQLLQAPTAEKKRYLEVSKISSESKALALELDVAVILLSQLSREQEKQADRAPKLSDLRESGSLEQDADIVFLLHHPKSDDESLVNIHVAKNRDGRTDVLPMRFDKRTVNFSDWIEG